MLDREQLEQALGDAAAFETLEPPDERQLCAKPTRAGGTTSPAPSAAETARFFFNGPRDVGLLIEATICTVRRHIERQIGRLPTRGEAMEAMFEHVFETWRPKQGRVPNEHRIFDRAAAVGAHDLIIAATAVALDFGVLTRDQRFFSRIPDLDVVLC